MHRKLGLSPLGTVHETVLGHRQSNFGPTAIVTLPALQKHFVDFFFKFAWEFCIEKRRGFLVNFFWSPFPTKQRTKTPEKFGENSEQNSGQNSGRKFEKFGDFSFCIFWSDSNCPKVRCCNAIVLGMQSFWGRWHNLNQSDENKTAIGKCGRGALLETGSQDPVATQVPT